MVNRGRLVCVCGCLMILLVLVAFISCANPMIDDTEVDCDATASWADMSESDQEIQNDQVMRPILYYQNQKYDLLHGEGNKINVTDMSIEKLGIMRYPGPVLSENLDTSDECRVGDEVYVYPEKENVLIYHCGDCNEYFCITTEFVPLETVKEIADPLVVDPGDPRPTLYYKGSTFNLINHGNSENDISEKDLKYIGITRCPGFILTQDLDVNSPDLAGAAIYVDSTGGLVCCCNHCDSYVYLQPD